MSLKQMIENTSLYFNKRVYYVLFLVSTIFTASYFKPFLFDVGIAVLLLLSIAVLTDILLLYSKKGALVGERVTPDRLSNGDDNPVSLHFENGYGFKISMDIIDELPYQFQERTWLKQITMTAGESSTITYLLKPTQRGAYHFGIINVYVESPLQVIKRRFRLGEEQTVKVYPSYVQMRRYQLMGVANRMQESGSQRLRKLGQSMEFEQIKEYVRGDDYRTINWKATARRGDLMVNNFTDERSQQIYCVINKGRTMKMPFDGMTLLDYAINASLVLSNTALIKQDKAGLIAFAENLDVFLSADRKPGQLNVILEQLYKQETDFLEPDLEKLFSVIRNRVTQRSLIILFTNYESLESLERELPSLKRIAHYHLLMVVFFENTGLKQLIDTRAKTTEDIYIKTIAEKYLFERQLIAKELQKNGIISVLTSPEKLTVNALNKYLEIKNRQSI